MAQCRIVDLYFFEELSDCLGEEIGYRWLVDQSRKARSKKILTVGSGMCASEIPSLRTRSAPTSPLGRDVPNAKLEIFRPNRKENSGKSFSRKLTTHELEISRNEVKSTLERVGLKTLHLFTNIQEDGSFRTKLMRSDSFERNVGLLFTDAAHKILD